MIRRLATVGLAGVAVATAVVVCAGLWLVAPVRRTVGPAPSELPGAETVAFPSASGAELRGWLVPPSAPGRGMVMLLHGWRESRLNGVARAVMLTQAGYGVLLFDLGAHGESTGRHVTFGAREGEDAAAARAFLARRFPAEGVAAIGFSLGGAALLMSPTPLRLRAAVLEAVFPTVDDALRNRLRFVFGRGLAWLGTPVLEALMEPIVGVDPATLRPIDHVAALDAPVLFIGGADDNRTPAAETTALFDAAREPKQLWLVPGIGHADYERQDPATYRGHVLPFLARAFRRD